MNIKSVILMGVIVLMLIGVSSVYADTIVMDNYTFTIPEGFTVVENDT